MIDKQKLINILQEYTALKGGVPAFPNRWMQLPADISICWVTPGHDDSLKRINDQSRVHGLRGYYPEWRKKGVDNAKWVIDYVTNIDPKMNFIHGDSAWSCGTTPVTSDTKPVAELLEIADYCQSKNVKFGITISKTTKRRPFDVHDGRYYATVPTHNVEPGLRHEGWYFPTWGWKDIYHTFHRKTRLWEHTLQGPVKVTYNYEEDGTERRIFLRWENMPTFRWIYMNIDFVYTGAERISVDIDRAKNRYMGVNENTCSNELLRDMVHTDILLPLVYIGDNVFETRNNMNGLTEGTLDQAGDGDTGIAVGYRMKRPWNSLGFTGVSMPIFTTGATDRVLTQDDDPPGFLELRNIFVEDCPEGEMWGSRIMQNLPEVSGMFHQMVGLTTGFTHYSWAYQNEIVGEWMDQRLDEIEMTQLATHPAITMYYREEDETRAPQGWDYDYPSGTYPGEHFGKFMARMSNKSRAINTNKDHMMFPDMFSPWHNARKYLHGCNPGPIDNPEIGGYLHAMDFYDQYNDVTPENDNLILAEWSNSYHVLESADWADSTGHRWVLSYPLIDGYSYCDENDVGIGKMAPGGSCEQKSQYVLDKIREGTSKCEGMFWHGWNAASWDMCPGQPGYEDQILKRGGPDFWVPWIEKFRDARK